MTLCATTDGDDGDPTARPPARTDQTRPTVVERRLCFEWQSNWLRYTSSSYRQRPPKRDGGAIELRLCECANSVILDSYHSASDHLKLKHPSAVELKKLRCVLN